MVINKELRESDNPEVARKIIILNLTNLLIVKNLKQKELADIVGISEPAICNWFNGKTKRIDYEKLYKIAKYFNMQMDELTKINEELHRESERTRLENIEIHQGSGPINTINKLPLLSWIQAGAWAESIMYNDIEYIETPINIKHKQCFALQVRGDSMSRATGKSYFDGCYIVVDPKCSKLKEDLNHKVVVARKGADTTLKEFILDGNTPYLKPWNTSYPTLSVDENTEIIGIVISMWSD